MPRVSSRRRLTPGRIKGATGRGFVLSPARPESVAPWARRGIAPLTLAQLQGWTVVAPAGPPMARAPYDDAVRTLAGRPAGHRMRPALGFFHIGHQAVVTLLPRRIAAVQLWAVWTPRDARVDLDDLRAARPVDLINAAGTIAPDQRSEVAEALADLWSDGSGDALGVLRSTLSLLGLPGVGLLTGDLIAAELPGARTIVPRERHALAFDRLVAERAREEEENADL